MNIVCSALVLLLSDGQHHLEYVAPHHCPPPNQPLISSVFLPTFPRESQILFSVDDRFCPDLGVPALLLEKDVGDVICLSLDNLSSLCSAFSSALVPSVFTSSSSSRARTSL